jgi:hypothetical protein
MKKKILFLFLLVSSVSFAQNVRFEGTITDNNKAPLEMANVMAMNQGTKAMDAYAITNEKGKFILNLNANATYIIKLSYLGMQSKEIAVTTQTQNITQNITMESGGIDLEGVEIVREMPVSIKGDTIVYNSDSFTNGTERKLEDVLKKLPGVEVDAEGQVKVEGKSVTKLMVDGKDFFDGDTKLGVKNIPADAIDKVQVLRNYNENSIMKGVENNQDNLAMNIKLKEGKKNFWFGDMTAGAGVGHVDTRYNIAPKAFYYSPKYSINIMGNSNNVGEQAFTIQDYFRFSGGFRNITGKGGGSINVGSNSLGINFFQDDRVKEIESHFGATNFSYNPSKSWSFSGFVIATSTLVDTDTQSTENFLQPNSEELASTEIRQDLGNQKNNLGLFKLSSTYKPNAKFQFDYDILTRLSAQRENNNLNRQVINYSGTIPNFNENILTAKEQDPININQNLSFYFTPTDKHIFAFESQYLYQNEDPLYNANLEFQPFVFIGYNPDQNRNDITQSRFIKTNKFDSRLDYYYVLTPKVNLNFTLANSYVYQSLDSSIFQRLDNGTINNLTDSKNTNDVGYRFNDSSLGFHIKWLTGKFTFTPGVTLHRFNLTNSQLATNTKQELTRFLPDFQMIYQIKKSESLTYNFALTNNFTNVNNFAKGKILNSYKSLFSGNRDLENSVVHSHTLNYQKFNMFNFENFGGRLSYTRTTDAFKTKAFFDGVNQISEAINGPFADEQLSGDFRYGRSFLKYYKANFSTTINWSKFYNIQVNRQPLVDEVVNTETLSQNYKLGASTNFKDIPNIELSYNYTVNQYPNDTFYTDSPSVKLDYFFLKSFSFVSEYEFFHYYNNDNTVDQEYDFLSASLTYQKTKASHMEYRISATNILNTTSINDDSFSQFSTRNSQYQVQPRYIIFSLKYNL